MAAIRKTGGDLRDEVEQLMRDDLVGPAGGPDEEVWPEAPADRYILGVLAPRFSPAALSRPGPESDEPPQAADAVPDDALAVGGAERTSSEEGTADERPPAAEQLVPSAFGMTFAVAEGVRVLQATARWGTYERQTSETVLDDDGKGRRVWKRLARGGTLTITLPEAGAVSPVLPDIDVPDVVVRGLVRRRGPHRLVSLFLVNKQVAEGGRDVPKWLCQAELSARAVDGDAIFVRRAIDPLTGVPEIDRDELGGLELLHRRSVEIAVGHGVAVDVECSPTDPTLGTKVTTAAMPAQDVPRTDPPEPADFVEWPAIHAPLAQAGAAFDMQRLAEAGDAELPGLLAPLADAYEAWIEAQAARDEPDLAPHRKAADRHLYDARIAAGRIRAGIAVLSDPLAAEAFRFANHAMWQQRVHTLAAEARRQDEALKLESAVAAADVTKNRSWRPFQLAFVLINLPALVDPKHAERVPGPEALVDLLFFPTGGGKTEAYLGLTAFAIAIRRLQGPAFGRDGRDGVAVLMRYTLRLLTLQQFQRAAGLLCACELRRRALYGRGETDEHRRWGKTPMRIGLWVGRASTPNSTERAADWVQKARGRSAPPRGSSPLQLARCPWCGSKLEGGRDVVPDTIAERTLVCCSDTSGSCPFTPRNSPDEGLPVVTVDDEVYRLLPALVIATVDKLARMPWEGRTAALFGQVTERCERHGYLTPSDPHAARNHRAAGSHPVATVLPAEPLRPPDLVIQDELHLIAGPLGSLVGLYETAVDELSGWEVDGTWTRPKVIASTATIRRAANQVRRLYERRLAVFPPPGLDARDSFFAVQRDKPGDATDRPGRRFLGVCAPGRRYKAVLIRVYVAQLRAAWTVLGRQPGDDADAYMTLVGYFNSLRELGGMRRLVEDDVQNRMFRPGEANNRGRLVLEELTSRKTASEIPEVLDQLSLRRVSQAPRAKDEAPAIDVLLATNMISVGVDVPRLGAMVVAGQPKSTSEYIQATSRVGRAHPGLVVAVYNWARPRDLSHYETFGHYHRTLYRQVEALSVTPFAPRALDRGLTGVLASLLRLCDPGLNSNSGAGAVQAQGEPARRAIGTITRRAGVMLDHSGTLAVGDRLAKLLDEWEVERDEGQRTLVYQARRGGDTDVSLLQEPGLGGWQRFTVPTSLRDVEPSVGLILRPGGVRAPAADWDVPDRPPPKPPKDDS
jgi:hypothetical protein